MILQAAESCGIRFGASRKSVRSEKMKNALLSKVTGLQWAGINTSGCTAIISIRESKEESPAKANVISNIIADRDGYVLETTITNGTAQISPGDTVTKGQLLISGYTDCGICIRTSRAEGEILAQTQRNMQVVMPKIHYVSTRKEKPYYSMSFLIGKKRINLWKDSRISGTGYDRMYEEYYVSLPGGFQLPFAICIDQYFLYNQYPKVTAEKDALPQMQKFSENYLEHDMIGGRILRSQHHFKSDEELYYLQSSYTCMEMIGKECREEIGVMNGKRY
jgi:similar to stage IV sporulation protein